MVKKVVKKYLNKKDNSIICAFVATFFSVIGFVITIIFWKDDDYAMFYAKQSLVIFVIAIVVSLLNKIFIFIPIIGFGIMFVLNVVVLVLWVLSWVYAISGEKKDVWIAGILAKSF